VNKFFLVFLLVFGVINRDFTVNIEKKYISDKFCYDWLSIIVIKFVNKK